MSEWETFYIQPFDCRINISMQKHFIEDLLFQQDINAVLKKTNLSTMEKDK